MSGGGPQEHKQDVVYMLDFFIGGQGVRVGDQDLKGVKESLERP